MIIQQLQTTKWALEQDPPKIVLAKQELELAIRMIEEAFYGTKGPELSKESIDKLKKEFGW